MKIFSWVQNKLTNKKSNPIQSNHQLIQQPCKEEFSDWPHDGLLAIGTFGNNKIKQQEPDHLQDQANLIPTGLTPEEVGKLQKELTSIFDQHVGVLEHTSSSNDLQEAEERNNCSSNNKTPHNDDHHFQYNNISSLVQSKAKDVCSGNSKGSDIGKKSLSFLLKKMFLCSSSGFSAAPSLRDPNPILESRMDKILRTLLHKKIYPQSSGSPKLSSKKSLESARHIPNKTDEKPDDGSKWVKTDSEYIVLEI